MILTVTMNPSLDKIYFVKDYHLGEVHRPSQVIASPGGKGLNVARVAKIMGEEVGATGPIGGGVGAYIEEGVKALGIKALFCPIDGESRTCINVSDSTTQASTEVLEPGPYVQAVELQKQNTLIDQVLDQVKVMTISGSLAKGIPIDYYYQLIKLATSRGVLTILDSSGPAFVEGIKAKPYAIKPNKDEIHQIYHRPVVTLEDKVEAIKYFRGLGIELPIISMGSEGSLVGMSSGIYQVTIPKVDVVNSVGSGDSFIAGLAVGIARQLDEEDLLKLATACGTANTQYPQTGYVEVATVEAYYNDVKVSKISDY